LTIKFTHEQQTELSEPPAVAGGSNLSTLELAVTLQTLAQ